MKKLIIIGIFGILILTTAFSQGSSMDGGKHDLYNGASITWATDDPGDQICVFCHVPHGGSTGELLWNRSKPATAYTTYESGTMEATSDSRFCLSCHDGATAIDAMTQHGAGDTGDEYVATASTGILGSSKELTGVAALGTDLSDTHPVSIVYAEATDHLQLKATAITNGVKLFGDGSTDYVECGSCHDPHAASGMPCRRC